MSLDISKFDTSIVTDFYNIFYNCTNLISLDLTSFNISSATASDGMFAELNPNFLYCIKTINPINQILMSEISNYDYKI